MRGGVSVSFELAELFAAMSEFISEEFDQLWIYLKDHADNLKQQ